MTATLEGHRDKMVLSVEGSKEVDKSAFAIEVGSARRYGIAVASSSSAPVTPPRQAPAETDAETSEREVRLMSRILKYGSSKGPLWRRPPGKAIKVWLQWREHPRCRIEDESVA
ncbi:MAG: hypothetical protein ACKPKO_59130, partial [Candidatus Fonsibacter sp.]